MMVHWMDTQTALVKLNGSNTSPEVMDLEVDGYGASARSGKRDERVKRRK